MRLSTISIISSLIITGTITAIFIYQLQPPLADQRAEISIDVPQKLSFTEISEKLDQFGLIRSKMAFKIYSLITGRAHRFKPGKYFFPPADKSELSTPKLTKILVRGPKEIPIIIYPGMTLKEIDERLTNSGIIQKNELINISNDKLNSLKDEYSFLGRANLLEGFLFPDTYYFFPVTNPNLVVKKILDNFELN